MAKFRPKKFLSPRDLNKILARYECTTDVKRGKGSHRMVMRTLADGVHCYPLPEKRDYGRDYLNALRRKLHLAPADGITDEEFYTGKKPRT